MKNQKVLGKNNDVRAKLESSYKTAEKNIKVNKSVGRKLSALQKSRIDAWKYGEYGWHSPVNIILTAAWYKWLNPKQDICRLWSRDNNGTSIPGGYSVRSNDETYTVELVNKYDIYKNFCSPNSGMQGARALEKNKLRESHKSVERNSELGQKVKWDTKLFCNILVDLNENSSTAARDVFIYLLEKSIRIKQEILSQNKSLKPVGHVFNSTTVFRLIYEATQQISDPQLIKVIVVAINELIYEGKELKNYKICGIDGSKTGADARSKSPGDVWVEIDNKPAEAFEVKDRSKNFKFSSLRLVEERQLNNPSIQKYYLITAAKESVDSDVAGQLQWSKQIESIEGRGLFVICTTLMDYLHAVHVVENILHGLPDKITELLPRAVDIKKNTVSKWKAMLKQFQLRSS